MFLTFGWRTTVFASNNFCECVYDTCSAGSCDYKNCAISFPDSGILACDHPIWLLQPLDDKTKEISPTSGKPFQTLQEYFGISWPWIIGSAAGIAVLWAIVGGMEIMLSGSDSGMRDRGKGRFINAIVGLLVIGLSGMILEILNPVFFQQ